ncbi:hypothetical protein EDC96DRAFT_320204 [Choanephora cucurbitarum]|nr:hypothetical protein EDC96DRAFT_320204 [Choanephora cucurbitarum]
MNSIDPYNRIYWLSSTTKSKKRSNSLKQDAFVPPKHFDSQILDTFCFHWPDMKTYVLVKVLRKTIAILPVRSRLAFLYFHHAPFPHHPSTWKKPKRQGMFHGWKHTLALEPDRQECSVTLSDVLADQQGWIHAVCQVHQDSDSQVTLTTENTTLHLKTRCATETTMFINLVRFHQQPMTLPTLPPTPSLSLTQCIECHRQSMAHHLSEIERMKTKLDQSKQAIASYSDKLIHLQQQSLENIPPLRLSLLYSVQSQLSYSTLQLESHQQRMDHLQDTMSRHTSFLKGSRQRYEQIRSRFRHHHWQPYFLFCLVILLSLYVLIK